MMSDTTSCHGIIFLIVFFSIQVSKLEQELKHKLRPDNAYFKAVDFDPILSAPKEELHQLLIGLYGEHLLPATMYEIEKVLRSPDTISGYDKNGAAMYVISKTRLKDVYARLRNRLSSVDSSTSTIEISTDYAAHFYDMYIKKHDGKHMTGHHMKILMLNLPFLLRDLIEPEASSVLPVQSCKAYLLMLVLIPVHLQLALINSQIAKAKTGPLKGKAPVQDPMESIVQAHVSMLEWHMQSRKFGMTAAKLELLQQKSVEVMESFVCTFPEKNGVKNGWKFEKAHSILHKVRELILFGWSENFSTQGPEHCHIDFVKKIAHCTNNKEVFLTIIRHHVREGHLQYLQKLRADLLAEEEDDLEDRSDVAERIDARNAKNDSLPCELGLRYPLLQSIMSGHRNHQTLQVTHILPYIVPDIK